jgi:hypothetical protein
MGAGRVIPDQALERGARPVERPRVGQQAAIVVRGEHDSEEVEGELPGIRVGPQVSGFDRQADRLGDCAAQLALAGNEQVSNGARSIVY